MLPTTRGKINVNVENSVFSDPLYPYIVHLVKCQNRTELFHISISDTNICGSLFSVKAYYLENRIKKVGRLSKSFSG